MRGDCHAYLPQEEGRSASASGTEQNARSLSPSRDRAEFKSGTTAVRGSWCGGAGDDHPGCVRVGDSRVRWKEEHEEEAQD